MRFSLVGVFLLLASSTRRDRTRPSDRESYLETHELLRHLQILEGRFTSAKMSIQSQNVIQRSIK
jgi:hypothetical protein